MAEESTRSTAEEASGATGVETGDVLAVDIDEIDLDKLAREVVALLKRELRLERERLGAYRDRRR